MQGDVDAEQLSAHQRTDENTQAGAQGRAGPFGRMGIEGMGDEAAQKRFQTMKFQDKKGARRQGQSSYTKGASVRYFKGQNGSGALLRQLSGRTQSTAIVARKRAGGKFEIMHF